MAAELDHVLRITQSAFGTDEEANLVRKLMNDPTAEPLLSLLAVKSGTPVGHILFSAVRLAGHEEGLSILAPLSVIPRAQSQGVGGALIHTGLKHLSQNGTSLVFVLGHPDYYSRFGFQPAGRLGLEAPYPIPNEHADAWMVQGLKPGALDGPSGRIECAKALDKREYWVE